VVEVVNANIGEIGELWGAPTFRLLMLMSERTVKIGRQIPVLFREDAPKSPPILPFCSIFQLDETATWGQKTPVFSAKTKFGV
jgi:hypothetical protein